jgi:hypothetical protein
MTTLQSPGPVQPRVELDYGVRLVCNRRILKLLDPSGYPIWHEITRRQVPTYESSQDGGGKPGFVDKDEVTFSWGGDPARVIEQLMEMLALTPFDPRPENKLHDELDAAVRAGFSALVQEFHARNKVLPREVLTGLPLGEVLTGRGVAKLAIGREQLLAYLARHRAGDWGIGKASEVELSDDMLWCPPLYGQAVENAASIHRGRGLVQSMYDAGKVETRHPDELKICTLVNHTTVIYCPARGDV